MQDKDTDVTETSPQSSVTDATDELATSQAAIETSITKGGDVATARRAATRSRKRTAASTPRAARARDGKAKTAKRVRAATTTITKSKPNGKWESGNGLPDPSTLRLARGGVAAGAGSTIDLSFANGYAVHMKVSGEDPEATRDNLVTWLRKRLGADRT